MIEAIRSELLQSQQYLPDDAKRFFKTGAGDYSEHDRFLGVSAPTLRKIAKSYYLLSIHDIQKLMTSEFNEERLLALFILINRYQKNGLERQHIYDFYLKNICYVNNWNLVDASAHYIIGAHIFHKNKSILTTLAKSKVMWKRRISIVATWYFIRQNQFSDTIKIANLLLNDQHDLIHKAVGWMLREMGKRDQKCLMHFLKKNASVMPRTMLRYAIEKFPADACKQLLQTIHYVYILQCSNDTYYTGYTTDVTRRYQEHVNKNDKCRYTRSFPPKKLVAFWCFDDKSIALKEEVRIKKLSRSEKEKMILEYKKTNKNRNCRVQQ